MGCRRHIVTCVLVVILVGITGNAFAQEARTNAVTINPLGMIVGAISGKYESELSPGTALGIEGLFWNPNLGPDLNLSAVGGSVGVQKYPGGRTLEGFYYGGFASFASVSGSVWDSWTGTYETASASVFGIVGNVGFKWVTDGGFVADLGVGIGIPISTTVSAGNISETAAAGVIGTSLGFGIGYAW